MSRYGRSSRREAAGTSITSRTKGISSSGGEDGCGGDAADGTGGRWHLPGPALRRVHMQPQPWPRHPGSESACPVVPPRRGSKGGRPVPPSLDLRGEVLVPVHSGLRNPSNCLHFQSFAPAILPKSRTALVERRDGPIRCGARTRT